MSDFEPETLQNHEQLILKGECQQALVKINAVLDSKVLSKNNKLIYNILKAKCLTKSDKFFQAMSLLDDIKDDVNNIGTELQQLDFILIKIENLIIFGKTDLGMKLIEDAENLIENIPKDETNILIHKKVDLLILKAHIISFVDGFTDKLHKVLELSLQLCKESKYEYGQAKTLERLTRSYREMGKKEEAINCNDEAHEIWKRNNNKIGIVNTTQLKGAMITNTNPELSTEYLEEALKLSEEIDGQLVLSVIHNAMGILLFRKDERKEAMNHFEISLKIKRDIGDKFGLIMLLFNMGSIYTGRMENEKALSYLHEGLALVKEIDFTRPYYLIQFALTKIYIRKGELNRALNFLEEAVKFYEEYNMIENLTWARGSMASVQTLKGDLDAALQNHILCQEFYEKEYRTDNICDTLNNIAEIHQLKGDYNLALNYYNKSEELARKTDSTNMLAYASYYLINCYLARKENEKAEKYLETLQQYNSKLDSKPIKVMTNLAKALVYSKKENSADREEAKELFESVINEKDIEHKLAVTAILNLCELLIVELRESEDLKLLEKLKSYVEKLHQEGTAELAYPLLVHSIWLQANISLLELDVTRARRLFKSAQIIAESKEMLNLARRISNNYDTLLGQLDLWEQFTMQLPTIAERMELTHIETVLNEMVKGRGIVFPEGEVEIEEPILVSIFSENGATL
ncbi:MAG: tetratricopeptide repeat protein, partial [Candidatus Heimdallarchaeaceae archaeon]